MNIATSFADYMEDLALGVIGTSIFLGSVPQNAPSSAWWVVASGGTVEKKNDTGEVMKNYIINVYYRDLVAENVYNYLHNLEVEVNSGNCTQLEGFDTIDMSALAFPTDQDIDSTDRTVGLLQVTIRTYYKE